MKKIIIPIALVSVFALALLPSFVFAQSAMERLSDVQASADLPSGTLETTIGLIINTLLSLVGVLLVVYMVYAGYLWMTAGGNDDQINKAKGIIKNSIIGLIIVLLSYGIARFVLESLLVATAG